jgi:hypothetical protein
MVRPLAITRVRIAASLFLAAVLGIPAPALADQVLCCDGTRSPTCTYVHRGCCSHHGGVCDEPDAFVAMPILVFSTVVFMTLYAPAHRRLERVALGVFFLAVPYLIERWGIVSPTWIETRHEVHIVPRMIDAVLPGWMYIPAASMQILMIIGGLFPVLNQARRTEIREQSRAWMLRRVLEVE